jgi:hypothetical protein
VLEVLDPIIGGIKFVDEGAGIIDKLVGDTPHLFAVDSYKDVYRPRQYQQEATYDVADDA